MNECLNCGKKVENKYCGTTCQNEHRKTILESKYYLEPKKCLCCDGIIEYEKRRNTFCSKSCSVMITNKDNSNNSKLNKLSDEEIIELFNSSTSIVGFYESLGYSKKPNKDSLEKIKSKVATLGLEFNLLNKQSVANKTKVELFSNRANWQSARSAIAKHSRMIFENSDKPKCCLVCGYDKHYDVAHIKSVSSFSDETKISEINDINNLMGLCKNHHWEYDNNLLENILR